MTATFGGVLASTASLASMQENKTLRWGIVGTGGIANNMAPRIQQAENCELHAVSSRKMETAKEFANQHGISHPFDSWADMITWDGVDAIYVATPTSVKEEICLASAGQGKHVLGEKPFANLPSLQLITAACRKNGVAFMDGTHFVHHPRTAQIKANMAESVGSPWSVASAFQFSMSNTDNIRLIPALEPYGAIGDTGWYNMRAAVEYLSTDVKIVTVDAYLRRERQNNAVISGSGVITFDDGSTSTWNCGFDSGGAVMDLRISGTSGVIKMNDFLSQRRQTITVFMNTCKVGEIQSKSKFLQANRDLRLCLKTLQKWSEIKPCLKPASVPASAPSSYSTPCGKAPWQSKGSSLIDRVRLDSDQWRL